MNIDDTAREYCRSNFYSSVRIIADKAGNEFILSNMIRYIPRGFKLRRIIKLEEAEKNDGIR